MLIPVGLDKDEVRRTPWVSFGIIAANTLVFFLLWTAARNSDAMARASLKLQEVVQYLFEHPYLRIPRELEPYFGPSGKDLLEKARFEFGRRSERPVDWAVRRQQQKLNEMSADAFAIIRGSPILKQGFVPGDPQPIRLLTSMFVHGGWLHLIGNMLFFFATGPFLEDVFGRVLFSFLYFLSGLAAIGVHIWQNPGSLAPVIGASGAIAGILGAFLIRFSRSKIQFLWLPIPLFFWWRIRVFIPAFVFLPLWFGGQFLLATTIQQPTGTALWAHVGGFAFGAIFALMVWASGIEKRFINPSIESQIGWTQNQALVHAMESASRGDLEGARRETDHVLRLDPKNVDARRYAYEVALDAHNWKDLAAHATRLLEIYIQKGETDLARNLIEETTRAAKGELPPRFLLRAGDLLSKQGDVRAALELYRYLADSYPSDPASLRGWFNAAELYRKAGGVEQARDALRRVRSHPAFSPEWAGLWDTKTRELEKADVPQSFGKTPRS